MRVSKGFNKPKHLLPWETLNFKGSVEDNGCRNNLFGLEQTVDRILLEKYRLSK